MKKYFVIVTILTLLLSLYSCEKLAENESKTENYENTEIKTSYNTYKDEKYAFEFKYREDFKLEESSPCITESKSCSVDLKLNIINPDLPKKMTDCCYTKEEIEKYGQQPSITIEVLQKNPILTDISFPESLETLVKNVEEEGISKEKAKWLFYYLPSVGEANPNSSKPTEYKDICEDHKIVDQGVNLIIKSTGCMEGIVEKTIVIVINKVNQDRNFIKFEYDDKSYEEELENILKTFKYI